MNATEAAAALAATADYAAECIAAIQSRVGKDSRAGMLEEARRKLTANATLVREKIAEQEEDQ